MKKIGKKVINHLKEDVRDEKAGVKREKHRMVEDKELMKSIKDAHEMREGKKRSKKKAKKPNIVIKKIKPKKK